MKPIGSIVQVRSSLGGDCYRLPFRHRTFDRVINIYNLEHLLHFDFALEETRRILNDDAELLVSVPAEGRRLESRPSHHERA